MIKKGFTLSEMLITLGIIGIIAAISVPAVVSNLPCKSKINFIKAYGSLSSIISDIASDETLYPISCASQDLTCTEKLLEDQPAPANGYNVGGSKNFTNANDKLARLVASKMNLNDNNYNNGIFTTTDGTEWTFTASNVGDRIVSVTVKVLGEADTTNTFTVNIDKNGGVHVPAFEREVLNTASDTKKVSFKALMKKNNKAPCGT